MPKPKIFVDSASHLPRSWAAAAGMERHHAQGWLIIVAPTKKEAADLLTDRNIPQRTADQMVAETRVDRGGGSMAMLIEAGVIDPTAHGHVYVLHNPVKGSAVVEIPAADWPTPKVVARFGYESSVTGRGLYVEPITEEQA